MTKHLRKTTALGGAAALVLLTAAPGHAATVVAEATAAALEISVAGSGTDSGRVVAQAQDDGSTTVEGQVNPPVDVLDDQQLLNIGVLAQDAVAELEGRDGVSAACSGVAGPGGAVAEIGDNSCITPGQPIDVSIANLDLTGLRLADPEGALAPLNQLGDPVVAQLLGPVTAAISDALSQAGTLGLGGTLGAVEARCEAEPGSATGTATIANSQLTADLNGTEIVLLDFPANPAPNTEVVTELDQVANVILDALRVDLKNSLEGALDPVGEQLIAPVQEALIDGVVAEIAPQLQPLEDNVLRATLNKQVSTGAGQIDVTAIDLAVLPGAAESPLAAPLIEAAIANVTCGPNARVGLPQEPNQPAPNQPGPNQPAPNQPAPNQPAPNQPAPPAQPTVPTVVASGVGGTVDDNGLLIGGLVALAGVAGVVGYRSFAR